MIVEGRLAGGPDDGVLLNLHVEPGALPPDTLDRDGALYRRDPTPIARAGQPALWIYRAKTDDTAG